MLALLDAEKTTYTVVTPRGEHRYYTVESRPPLPSTVGRLAPGIDTRAAGGFVLAAGSTRHVDGQQRRYRLVSPVELQPRPAPYWLRRALAVPGGEQHAKAGAPVAPVVAGQASGYVRAAVAGELARVRDATPGNRNAALFTAALHLGQLAAAGLLDERDAAESLRAASSGHIGVDGFTSPEVGRAIANGLRYGRQRPRRLPYGGTGRR